MISCHSDPLSSLPDIAQSLKEQLRTPLGYQVLERPPKLIKGFVYRHMRQHDTKQLNSEFIRRLMPPQFQHFAAVAHAQVTPAPARAGVALRELEVGQVLQKSQGGKNLGAEELLVIAKNAWVSVMEVAPW